MIATRGDLELSPDDIERFRGSFRRFVASHGDRAPTQELNLK